MTVFSKPAGTDSMVKRRRLQAPISLDRPETKTLVKGQYETMKLRTAPTDNDSPTYELTLVYFGSGTPEEWLLFQRNLRKVIHGQNLTTGPAKYALARRVLIGDALATFNARATHYGNETNDNFSSCLNDLTEHIFPARALQTQKRYMRRYLRKPVDTSIREYTARVVELNAYLPRFPEPRAGVAATALEDDELLDVLEFGCPNSWQRQMLLQDFDPVGHTVQEFVRFCERVEATEDKPEPKKKNSKSDNGSGAKKARAHARDEDSGTKKTKGSKDCMLHGTDCGHSTDQCYTLKAQAKRMKGMYEAQAPDKKKEFKKKQELHAIVAEAVEKALSRDTKASTGKRKRRAREDSGDEEDYDFDKLSIHSKSTGSESESESDKEE